MSLRAKWEAIQAVKEEADEVFSRLTRLRAEEAELRRAYDAEEKRLVDAYRERLRSE